MSYISGYQGQFNPGVSTTILSGATASSAISCGGLVLVGFILPAAFTGTAITFTVSDALAGTYRPLYDAANSLVSMTVAQGRVYAVDPKNFQGVQFLKLISGSAEGADRTVVCSLRGY